MTILSVQDARAMAEASLRLGIVHLGCDSWAYAELIGLPNLTIQRLLFNEVH